MATPAHDVKYRQHMTGELTLDDFLERLAEKPDSVSFELTMSIIDSYYEFTPTAFTNGRQTNTAGENNGACKILAFARLHYLAKEQTLHCFGDYYRNDVLLHPDSDSHRNIREYMQHDGSKLTFDTFPLSEKY